MNLYLLVSFCCLVTKAGAFNVLNRTHALSSIYFYLSNLQHLDEVEFRCDDVNVDLIKPKDINIIIIHGYTENHLKPHYLQIRDEYLKKYDCNVFNFDYHRLDQKGYPYAVEIAPDIGDAIAETLVQLQNAGIFKIIELHIITHSLGCHVAGFTGKAVYKITTQKLGKITCLDPAGPMFSGASSENRMCGCDANSVVVLHTDGLMFGANQNMGSLDIYFNPFRPLQPGCNVGDIIRDGEFAFCNHWISYKYFINTINHPQYYAIECSSPVLYTLGFCFNNRHVLYTEDIRHEITGTYFISADSPLPSQ